jgi:hypothetical protein
MTGIKTMSDQEIDQLDQESEVIEAAAEEQDLALESADTDDSSQDSEEAEAATVNLADLVGETEAQDDDQETKQHNASFARERVRQSKQLQKKQEKLDQLQAQIEQGQEPAGFEFKAKEATPEPMLDDFIEDEILFGKFKGEPAIALAKYNEAHSQWVRSNQSISTQRDEHRQKSLDNVAAMKAVEDKFAEDVETVKAIAPTIDSDIDNAHTLLGDSDFNAIRNYIGKNSPVVLGVIGASKATQAELADVVALSKAQKSPIELQKYLTRLEDKVVNNLPKKTHVSQAKAEEPISGGASSAFNVDKEIAKINKRTDLTAFDKAKQRSELKKKAAQEPGYISASKPDAWQSS